MNIFENHLREIRDLILKNQSQLNLSNIDNLKNINLEVPPDEFNFDLSCNVAMILGKSNNIKPNDLAFKIKKLLLDNVTNFSEIGIAGPGFINIKLSNKALIKNINLILKSDKDYGSLKDNKSFNIEFVSANPTGPMHVGHCRGAIYGDVYDFKRYENDALGRLEIRKKYRELINLGFKDVYRLKNKTKQEYTFWDYFAGSWQKNYGMRIDHFLLSNSLIENIKSININKKPRSKIKPSDHTPIELEII